MIWDTQGLCEALLVLQEKTKLAPQSPRVSQFLQNVENGWPFSPFWRIWDTQGHCSFYMRVPDASKE